MTTTLTTKNKVGFVDGSISRLPLGDLPMGVWTHCNHVMISWLLNAIAQDIADGLLYISTATEI